MRSPYAARLGQATRSPSPQFTHPSGLAVVEMAFCLPIFMMVVMAIVEFGRAFMVSNLMTEAARDGARLAIVSGSTNDDVEEAVQAHIAEMLDLDAGEEATVTISVAGSEDTLLTEAEKRDLCTVELSISFDSVSYLPGSFLGGINLRGQCAMRHE